jgi:hypothetical protein
MPEARAIRRAIGGGGENDRVAGVFVVGLGGRSIPEELPKEGVGAILLAGFGGALDPALGIGDVVAEGISEEQALGIGARAGAIHTARQIVGTAAEKAELYRRTGAMAVDMEGEAVAPMAVALGVPLVHLRAITDTCDHALDPRLLRCLGPCGEVKLASLVRMVVCHPAMIFPLVRLGLRSRRAARRLGEVVAKLCAVKFPSCV